MSSITPNGEIAGRVFDVIVIGGGHAGAEAAAAAARMGKDTMLITQNLDRIGVLSCNPSIGGIGKSHLVREVDALDGLMARAADESCIHNKTLNRSKGPAVRGVRVQADRALYQAAIQRMLRLTPGLTLLSGEAERLSLAPDGAVDGVWTQTQWIGCRALVVATGTFLRGVTHIGHRQTPAGRHGDSPAIHLAEHLTALGVPLGRLKTGTPPRLRRSSLDWKHLPADWGDSKPAFLSFDTKSLQATQVECRVTSTTPITHKLIRDNLLQSALYGGGITAVGPRYCPSIEDKIVRFADRDRHQVTLEPEGIPGSLNGDIVYPNGISTSLPADLQLAVVRSLPGLERAEITTAGYAVEYDFVQPRALSASLQIRAIPGLFLAGQITGTTGYEEAAAQGIYAGINAARYASNQVPFLLNRSNSYIGVMVDDLTSSELVEPYRMFTSRAEYRLRLRCDNADLRLTSLGHGVGCVTRERYTAFKKFEAEVEVALSEAASKLKSPAELLNFGISVKQDGIQRSLLDVIDAEQPTPALIAAFPEITALPARVQTQLMITGLYSGYLRRQGADIARDWPIAAS